MRATRLPVIGLAVLMVGFLAVHAASPAQASGRNSDDRRGRDTEQAEAQYPNATRAEPEDRVSSRLQRAVNNMIKALNDDGDAAKALELAKEVAANERANAYEKSLAYQVAGSAANELGDTAAALDFFQKAVDTNGLNNDAHFGTMQNIASLLAGEDRFAEAAAMLSRLRDETRSEDTALVAQIASAQYQAQQYDQVISLLTGAMASRPQPPVEWLLLLQAAYNETERYADAARVGEQAVALKPDDKQAVFALAQAYMDAGDDAKALATLESARSKGLLTTAGDYRALYSRYANIDGGEAKAVAVIEEGLAKGILERDLATLGALAQMAYFAEQMDKSLATYKEAAALDPKGETGLNYAKVLSMENRDAEARDAAQAALAKGLAKPGEAWMVIARSWQMLDNNAEAKKALQQAANFPETRNDATKALQQFR